jgi:hypothetical protein
MRYAPPQGEPPGRRGRIDAGRARRAASRAVERMLVCLAAIAAAAMVWHLTVFAQRTISQGPLYAADFPGSDIGAKINSAIAALPQGGTIILPVGDYTFSEPIIIDKPVWLVGQGVHGTVLSYAGSGASIVVEVGGQAPYLSGGLRGFELAAAEPGGGVGILQVNTIGFTYEELAVLHFGVGIWLDNRPAADCPIGKECLFSRTG